MSSSSWSSIVCSDSSSVWLRVKGFLQASAPSHIQKIVDPVFVQLHAAVRYPEALQLQWMSCNMSGGANNIPEGTVRGTRIPMWSSSHPYFVESNSGDSRSAAFHIATCRWHLFTFSVNASVVGGMEQSFTDDAPLFPVFERHILTLYSVMELHDSAT